MLSAVYALQYEIKKNVPKLSVEKMKEDASMKAVSDTSLSSPEKEQLLEHLSEVIQQGLPSSSSEALVTSHAFPPCAGQPVADDTQGQLVTASIEVSRQIAGQPADGTGQARVSEAVPRMIAGQPADVALGGDPMDQ